jgi:hypothetical protein
MDMKHIAIKALEIFLMNDQPFTCPHCGARCETLADFYHTNAKCFIQQCLNDDCAFVCYEEEDKIFISKL